MIDEIKIFLFVLSILFLLKNIFIVIFYLFSENPKPIKLNDSNKISLYLSIAYVITYFII